ncbi:MAG: permease [Candidatus Binataceae bacterium]|nr:permease [Candidatus Binataceae bacterium]
MVVLVGLYHVKWAPYWRLVPSVASGGYLGRPVMLIGAESPLRASFDYSVAYGRSIWKALLLALIVGAGLQSLVPSHWLNRWLGGAGHRGPALGAIAAVPSMMCTCCAAPLAVALGRSGASAAAVVAYWLGNPLLNPAALMLTWIVLGGKWVALRALVSLLLLSGSAHLARRHEIESTLRSELIPETGSSSLRTVGRNWLDALMRLSLGLLPEYAVLIFALGASQVWLLPHFSPGAPDNLVWLVGMAVVGTLFAVPTSGEIPIVQTMMAAGLGAPAAAALMVTLPALSLPSLVMLHKTLPAPLLIKLGIAAVAAGTLAGLLAIAIKM